MIFTRFQEFGIFPPSVVLAALPFFWPGNEARHEAAHDDASPATTTDLTSSALPTYLRHGRVGWGRGRGLGDVTNSRQKGRLEREIILLN